MDFRDFICNIFSGIGFNEPKQPRIEEPRSLIIDEPEWENNDEIIDVPRPFRGNHFDVFTDPLQMTRYFQSQMQNMMKMFFNEFNTTDMEPDFNGLTFSSPPQNRPLRDQFLKSGNDQPDSKVDTDLDGKVTPYNFSNVWDEIESNNKQPKLEITPPCTSRLFGNYQMNTRVYTRNSDGTVVEKRFTKDTEGNEETIVTHKIGDKTKTVITKKDKNGVETKIENFSRTNEGEIVPQQNLFLIPSDDDENPNFINIDVDSFWKRFFF